MDKHEHFQKSVDDTRFRMIDVGEKAVTRRRAIASGSISMSRQTVEMILAGALPKGDVLALAEVAGILGAKKTPELLPLCHPLELDSVKMKIEPVVAENRVKVSSEVICHAKTGAEMEALMAVNSALLCIYDLTKGVDSALKLEAIELDYKEGGKSGVFDRTRSAQPNKSEQSTSVAPLVTPQYLAGLRTAVLTVSDRCSKGQAEDKTGPEIVRFLRARGAETVEHKCIADEAQPIANAVSSWAREYGFDLIITTGGTGLSTRDVTPDALLPLMTRRMNGFGERLRHLGSTKNAMSWLSRAEAGQIAKALVFMLPGSTGAVSDSIQIFDELLPHALQVKAGGHHG